METKPPSEIMTSLDSIVTLSLAPHLAVSLLFIGSVFPYLAPKLRNKSQLLAHVLLGVFYLILPGYFVGATVTGKFNTLHKFLQAFIGAFHIGISLLLYQTLTLIRPEQSLIFSRLICSFFSLTTRMFAAYHLSEKSTRGLLISDQFIVCTLLTDGLWLLTEFIRFWRNTRSREEETAFLSSRTILWAEGRGTFYIENALYADSALCFIMALFNYAFPQHILKLVIRPEHVIDSHHLMWCRLFGCLSLLPALSSMSARFFNPELQVQYLASRLVTQILVFAINIYGHWGLEVYSPNHISAFMVSGFFMSFLFSAFYRMKRHYERDEDEEPLSPTTSTVTKTTTTTTKTLKKHL